MYLVAKKPDSVVCKQQRLDLPVYLHNLISAFVIRFLESIITELAMHKILIL